MKSLLIPLLLVIAGCQAAPGPIFPALGRPIVWPAAPDQPRIRYVGELRGELSLGARAQGWEAFKEFLGGPRPQVEFSRPVAVAVAAGAAGQQTDTGTHGRVFVADEGLGVVHMLDLATRRYGLLRGAPQDPLRVPLDLTLANGQLVVVDRGRAALDVFDLDGNWRCTRRWPELQAPVAIAYDREQGIYWVADSALHACIGIDRELQQLIRRIGQRGVNPGQFNFPTALAHRSPVGLVVADAMNFRIQVFDAAGLPVKVFGEKGDAAGTFSRPRGVAVDSAGHIYVVDNQFENVQVFNAAGQLLMAFGQGGRGPGEFSMPAGITIDSEDRIWVADSLNLRVQVFQYLPENLSWAR